MGVKKVSKRNVFDMMAERGVIFDHPKDALMAYPDLFVGNTGGAGTLVKAQKLFQRHRVRTGGQKIEDLPFSPYNNSFMEKTVSLEWNVHLFLTVRFRTKGPKQQTRTARASSERLPGLRDYLELVLGELSYFEVILDPSSIAPGLSPPTPDTGDCVFMDQVFHGIDLTMPTMLAPARTSL